MQPEEYHKVLEAVEQALAVCENPQAKDDVTRQRLARKLSELRIGLLSMLEPAETEAGGES